MPQFQTLLLIYSGIQLLPGLTWEGVSVQKFIHIFSQIYWFVCIEVLVVQSLMVVCISVGSVVISPLSFFIASIWFFSLYFLLVWLVVYLFCWSFQKKGTGFIYFLKSFCVCVSISFSSTLNLVISCLLPAFEFVSSCFSSSYNCDVRVSILDLFSLLLWTFSAISFPVDTALNVFQSFWYVVSSLPLVLKNIFISAFISLFIQ